MGLRSDIDEVREQIRREHLLLLAADVRVTLQKAKLLLADFLLEQKFHRMMRAIKANFNPAQPRVPAGNSDGGQWADANGSWESLRSQYARSGGINDPRVLSDADPEALVPGADYAARRGRGHHYVVRQSFGNREKYQLSDEVLDIFEQASTGKLKVPSSNLNDHLHRAYNVAVEAELDKFIADNNIEKGKMTPDQARKIR